MSIDTEKLNHLYAVITENDESKWDDRTGKIYHFPKRYLKFLQEGTQVVYYKGILKNADFRDSRLSDAPHYFGIAEIGKIYDDKESSKEDKFALIENYQPFNNPVIAKIREGEYIEPIPENRKVNYWRDGVRKINQHIFEQIVKLSGILSSPVAIKEELDSKEIDTTMPEFESFVEGDKKRKFVTTYERDPKLRRQAVQIHGYDCEGCGFNFERFYGEHGKNFIHVHHIQPISEFNEPKKVDPETDLTVLCPNCHAMIHRYRNKTLSMDQLKKFISQR